MDDKDRLSFGDILRHFRRAAGLKQEELAVRAGLSVDAIGLLERGLRQHPQQYTMQRLADALALAPAERVRFESAARRPANDQSYPVGHRGIAGRSHHYAAPCQGLPAPLTTLIGREHDEAVLSDLLLRNSARLVTLTGPGGVGKTRLAVSAAGTVAEHFADGVIFVDLAPLPDPELVIPTIAERLDVHDLGAAPQPARLIATLRNKHLLLLLDNVEHVVAAGAQLFDLLSACPRLVMLVTGREALRVLGEHVHPVQPLSVPLEDTSLIAAEQSAAVTLFVERARAAGSPLALTAATAPHVVAICRRLDGLPLAIELAAAWAPLLPPAALLARLESRLPLLVGGPQNLPMRQQTMRGTIAWSFDLLNQSEQQLFRRLCVFVGGCTLDAAQTVCMESEKDPECLARLAALVNKSLLRVAEQGDGEPRLTILETIREYGLEQLASADETEALRRRHADYYLALAEAAEPELAGPDQANCSARLEREHDNLRAALRWAQDRGDALLGQRLSGSLWRFWSARGYLTEGRRWLQHALAPAVAVAAVDLAARAKALTGAALLASEQGAFEEASALCNEAVALARERGASRDYIVARNAQGVLAMQQGRHAEAIACHDEALALAQESGYQAGTAVALVGLARTAGLMGGPTRAAVLAEQSLAAFREAGDLRGIAGTLCLMAWGAIGAGAFERAEALDAEALALFRMLGDTGQVAEVLWARGTAAQGRGHHQRAVSLYEESLTLRRMRGDQRGVVESLSTLGHVALDLGDVSHAEALFSEAFTIVRQHNDRWGMAVVLTGLGYVALTSNDLDRAQRCFGESGTLFQTMGVPVYLPWCLEGLASVAIARGQAERAARLCGAREALRARIGSAYAPPAGFARVVAAARAVLGDEAFAAAFAAGQTLSLEQALAEALE